MIISGTIRENIAFLDAGGDGERVVCAAKNACIWDYISELPDGLDTVLGEGGMGLSEGQVQRIAIARAFYHGAPIILLDEATSALDEATELEILKNIKAMKDKTCFIIPTDPVRLRYATGKYCSKTKNLYANKNYAPPQIAVRRFLLYILFYKLCPLFQAFAVFHKAFKRLKRLGIVVPVANSLVAHNVYSYVFVLVHIAVLVRDVCRALCTERYKNRHIAKVVEVVENRGYSERTHICYEH